MLSNYDICIIYVDIHKKVNDNIDIVSSNIHCFSNKKN